MFSSTSQELDLPDPNGQERDVYRLDLTALPQLEFERISIAGNGPSGGPVVNSDGTIVVWDSTASNFAADNNGGLYDVFVTNTNAPANSPAPSNQVPSALAQTLVVSAGDNLNIVLEGFDADGDSLSFLITEDPVNGSLTGQPPNLTYSAPANFSGTDTVSFVVQDADSTSAAARITINVQAGTAPGPADFSFTAVQRSGSRTIDLQASWPAGAVWSQVRAIDNSTTAILWDGQATAWSGSYTPEPGSTSVSFNSRYWLPGVVSAHDNIDVTVQLDDGTPTTNPPPTSPPPSNPPSSSLIGGDAWIDTDGDSLRDTQEAGDVGRNVLLYRCEPPWGIAATTQSSAPLGRFGFDVVSPGEYQIGTDAAGVTFAPPSGDNVIHSNGFSNCFTFSGAPVELGIGVVGVPGTPGTDPVPGPTAAVTGFAWRDSNGDGNRDTAEPADAGRTVTMFRCEAPWGVAGSGITDSSGQFVIADAEPGYYQFGTANPAQGFTILGGDNDIHGSGFTDCFDVGVGTLEVGVGLAP